MCAELSNFIIVERNRLIERLILIIAWAVWVPNDIIVMPIHSCLVVGTVDSAR